MIHSDSKYNCQLIEHHLKDQNIGTLHLDSKLFYLQSRIFMLGKLLSRSKGVLLSWQLVSFNMPNVMPVSPAATKNNILGPTLAQSNMHNWLITVEKQIHPQIHSKVLYLRCKKVCY